MLKLSLGAAAALMLLRGPVQAAPLLHPMFQDHAVLQRDAPIPVYGTTAPGEEVSVSLAGATRRAKADTRGQWRLLLPAMPAGGGPFTLEARTASGEDQVVRDVLVGDVFLCGGQSNMQFEVRSADNARAEMAEATDGDIRALTIATKDSTTPLETFAAPVKWTVSAPDTVGGFSASCYFFARDLRRTTHAPIGMVVAAWGGSRVRAWVSEEQLRDSRLETEDLDLLDRYRSQPEAAYRGWDAKWERWWRGLNPGGEGPWTPARDVRGWETAPAALGPWALWKGTSPDGFVGQMWLRTEVTLTSAQAAQAAVLDLGGVNEEDESWVNGFGVGGTSWSGRALHNIPPGVLHPGVNTVVTNIFCSWRNCGMSGPAESRAVRFANGTAAPLTGPWRYAQMADGVTAPQLPWGPAHGVSVIYNGMIAPIGPYGFKAAVWYQGESDIHFAPDYQKLLTALFADWRRSFRADLPFLVVQLPDFGPSPTRPVESELADVREAQRRAVIADPHAAYVVTIDVGDPASIHPTHKQEVGRRLALAAQGLLYGAPAPSGPRPDTAAFAGRDVRVQFKGVGGRLVSYSGSPTAFELCGPAAEGCRYVEAKIDGPGGVLLKPGSGSGQPTRVRYCWGDSPICTLSDSSALPASPFEIQIH